MFGVGLGTKSVERVSGRRNALTIYMHFGRLVLLVPVSLMGQTVSVNLSPPIQESGRAIALVQLSSPAKAQPAALQWTLRGTVKALQIEPGEQAITAKKQITCSAYAKGEITCVVWGPNRNIIHSGIVAKVIAAGTGFPGHLSRISAASADGSSLAVQMPPDSDASAAKSLSPDLSEILAAMVLLAILIAIYVIRRKSAGRSISKQAPASGRNASLH